VPTDFPVSSPSGARVRRSARLDSRVDQLRWPWRTTVEDTILDLGATVPSDELFALLGRGFQRRLTSEQVVLSRLSERGRHPRRSLIVSVLSDVADGAESAMEVRYARDVERAHGLP
jgi:hypothetical protein